MIDEIRKRNKQAMDVDSEEGDIQNPAFWGHRDRDHLLKMVDALAKECPIGCPYEVGIIDDELPECEDCSPLAEGKQQRCWVKWADAHARWEG